MTAALAARQMTIAEARRLTLDLIHEHGLLGWRVVFDNAKRRAGQCNYRTHEISLSKYLLSQRTYKETANTITHEVAHALVGSGHGHDAVWARKHRELGGDGKRCFEKQGVDLNAPWIGTCVHDKSFARYRRPKRLDGWRCQCPEGPSSVTWRNNR